MAIIQGILPPQPDFATLPNNASEPKIWDLCCSCWQQDPKERPDMSFIMVQLAVMRRSTSVAVTIGARRGVRFELPPQQAVIPRVQTVARKNGRPKRPLPESMADLNDRQEVYELPTVSYDDTYGLMMHFKSDSDGSNAANVPRSPIRKAVRFKLPPSSQDSPSFRDTSSSLPSEYDSVISVNAPSETEPSTGA